MRRPHSAHTLRLYGRHVWWSVFVSSLLAIFVALFVASGAKAETQSGQAFSISPPLLELSADPGETVTAKIKLTNISEGELRINAQLNDFGAKNETGEPNIIFDELDDTGYSLRQWIASPEQFSLASQESKTLEIPINVPTDAEPGGHYAVIRFTGTAPETEQNGVALSASIGSLVLMQVSGDIQTNAGMEEFFVRRPGGEKASFFENGPLEFVERIRNDGNVHVKPTGTIEIVDMFGSVVSTMRVNGDPDSADNPPRSILPDSIRRFDQKLDQTWLFGRYEARVNLAYGDDKQLVDSTTFWVVPYKVILIALVALAAIIFLLIIGIRRYNAFIVRKAQSSDAQPKSAKKDE